MKKWNWIAILTLGMLTACGGMGSKNDPVLIDSRSVERLYGVTWELKTLTVDGSRVIMHPDGTMTLLFAPQGQASGYAAVNNFSGQYSFDQNGRLSWPPAGLITTRKAGPPELMEKERAFLAGLPKTTRAILAGNALQLQSEDGNTVLTFLKTGA